LRIHGVTIIPATTWLPPARNTGWNPAKTAIRNQVNQWIRTVAPSTASWISTKSSASRQIAIFLVPALNCGDGIHPSPAGYYLMGKSVDLDLFEESER